MAKLADKNIMVEVVKNIRGGLSLCICNPDGGERVSGGKVSGCATIATFEVNAKKLIEAVKTNAFQRKSN